jgi:hypothetical protein
MVELHAIVVAEVGVRVILFLGRILDEDGEQYFRSHLRTGFHQRSEGTRVCAALAEGPLDSFQWSKRPGR